MSEERYKLIKENVYTRCHIAEYTGIGLSCPDKEERLQLENECLLKYSKAQMIQKYIDELEENCTLSDLWCKSQEENKRLNNIINENELLQDKDEFDQIYGFDKGLLFYKDSGTIILPWNNQDTALDVLYDLIKADMIEKVEE